jgi:hypothetical protein
MNRCLLFLHWGKRTCIALKTRGFRCGRRNWITIRCVLLCKLRVRINYHILFCMHFDRRYQFPFFTADNPENLIVLTCTEAGTLLVHKHDSLCWNCKLPSAPIALKIGRFKVVVFTTIVQMFLSSIFLFP